MKKLIIALGLGLITLTSCTKEIDGKCGTVTGHDYKLQYDGSIKYYLEVAFVFDAKWVEVDMVQWHNTNYGQKICF